MVPQKIIPFRWNIEKVNELGSLVDHKIPNRIPEFKEELLASTARILAFSGDSHGYFVGRSPENYFDFLSGAFYGAKVLKEKFHLFQFSARFYPLHELKTSYRDELDSLFLYMENIGLAPHQILSRKKGTTFIDLVYTGSTYKILMEMLKYWTDETVKDWSAVRKKIRLVGITSRTKNSPNTERWQQKADWIDLIGTSQVKNVSISWALWSHLGNDQSKATSSHHPKRWNDEDSQVPGRSVYHRTGLSIAYEIFCMGQDEPIRKAFKRELIKQKEMKYRWFKEYVDAVKP